MDTQAPTAIPTRTPKLKLEKSLEGERWFVEHHSGNHNLVIDEAEWKQSVFIYGCEDSTLEIKTKVKRIILDGCKKFAVKLSGAISGLEVYNCHRVEAQVLKGQLPVATISKTEGVTLHLNQDSLSCEVVQSSSSDVNISTPKDDGDQAWFHVPDQLKTSWDGIKFVTKLD